MTEILLLGSFHFMESSIDFSSDEVQDELDCLTQKLAAFKPDTIAIEGAIHQQAVITNSYQNFDLADLRNPQKTRGGKLGEIFLFGAPRPITYNNESIQIGYRLGKILGLNDIHAIDDDSPMSEVFATIMPRVSKTVEALQEDKNKHANDSLIERFQYYNSTDFSKLSHNIYIQANAIKIDGAYSGAEMTAKWYERNLKIFANIQQLATKSKKLFIIYGAGHLPILRELINADDNLKLVNVYEYL